MPDRALRVLMVTARYSPYMGGIETHTREVARRLVARGQDVTVLTTDPTRQLGSVEEADGVHIVRTPAWPARSDLHFAPGLAHWIAQGKWDVVHVQGYHTLVPPVAMFAARRAHLPYVVTFHGGGHSSRLRNSIRGAQRRMLAPLLRGAARLIALAEFELLLFGDELGIPRDRFVFIPNGCDLPARPAAAGASSDGPLIASVGRLERYKGHQRILAAMPHILAQYPRARLWIAGSGPYESALRRQAEDLGMTDRVEIRAVPPEHRERMADDLSQTSLVVLLSEYETQPIAVLEALALGRPALVADTSGLSELARRGLVRAVPLHSSPIEVANAVFEQLRNPIVPEELSLPTWDDCVSALNALYQEVASAETRNRRPTAPAPSQPFAAQF